MMAVRGFEDVEFGEEFETSVDVSMDRVRRFTRATGMTFGRFTDHEQAKKEGLPGAIVPGIMSQGILVAAIHAWAPGCEILDIDTVFRAPVQVDSKPTVRVVAIPAYVVPAPSLVLETLIADAALLLNSLLVTLTITFEAFVLAAIGVVT